MVRHRAACPWHRGDRHSGAGSVLQSVTPESGRTNRRAGGPAVISNLSGASADPAWACFARPFLPGGSLRQRCRGARGVRAFDHAYVGGSVPAGSFGRVVGSEITRHGRADGCQAARRPGDTTASVVQVGDTPNMKLKPCQFSPAKASHCAGQHTVREPAPRNPARLVRSSSPFGPIAVTIAESVFERSGYRFA